MKEGNYTASCQRVPPLVNALESCSVISPYNRITQNNYSVIGSRKVH